LPWTSIDPARYETSGDLSQLVAVADNRYQERIAGDEEFGWLRTDIDSYNERAAETSVSLLESVGRKRMKEEEDKKAERKAKQEASGPLLAEEGTLVAPDPELGDIEDADAATDEDDEEEEEEQGPDLLLRETARIVADMAELESDLESLKQQFAQLDEDTPKQPQIH
jgi:hypothetical protein